MGRGTRSGSPRDNVEAVAPVAVAKCCTGLFDLVPTWPAAFQRNAWPLKFSSRILCLRRLRSSVYLPDNPYPNRCFYAYPHPTSPHPTPTLLSPSTPRELSLNPEN
jgi:hypothetical protein